MNNQYPFEYTLDPLGSATVSNYLGKELDVEIPAELDGHPVVAIGEKAFHKCEAARIVLPEGVKRIENGAFSICRNLLEISLPETLERIDGFAFIDCCELRALRIPDSVTSIGKGALFGCADLSALHLPKSLTSLGGIALFGITKIPVLYVPDGLRADAEEDPFAGFEGHLALKEDHPCLKLDDGVLFDRSGKTLVHYPMYLEDTSYTVPEGVKRLLPFSFSNAQAAAIGLPDSLREIGEGVFDGCPNLHTLRIPEGCDVHPDAIGDCPKLEKRARRMKNKE